jgi:hypothetical protein
VIFTSNAILLVGKYHAQPEMMLISMGFFLMTLQMLSTGFAICYAICLLVGLSCRETKTMERLMMVWNR